MSCPICGGAGLLMATSFECENTGCKNHKKKQPNTETAAGSEPYDQERVELFRYELIAAGVQVDSGELLDRYGNVWQLSLTPPEGYRWFTNSDNPADTSQKSFMRDAQDSSRGYDKKEDWEKGCKCRILGPPKETTAYSFEKMVTHMVGQYIKEDD